MKNYRIRVAGRIFENSDPKVLIRRAVDAKRSRSGGAVCRNCGGRLSEPDLAQFGYCLSCIDRAIVVFQSHRRVAV